MPKNFVGGGGGGHYQGEGFSVLHKFWNPSFLRHDEATE